jgi:sorting nexin-27
LFVFYFIFKVIASNGDEKHSDIHSGEESSGSSNDYTERRSLAITIPDYSLLQIHDEKFYVFNIHIAGKILFFERLKLIMFYIRSTFMFKTLSRI